eukprot:TRINITY_DN42715_c0_g1_i1.p1 TRINITY_DN42715_c0_g1~~TRINITY_DN42715_c0_g1_i1.p1  ORF type:complete len:402 (-),score=68.39 TRINITY_DN42715_c0_g1_i1:346-1551(-)
MEEPGASEQPQASETEEQLVETTEDVDENPDDLGDELIEDLGPENDAAPATPGETKGEEPPVNEGEEIIEEAPEEAEGEGEAPLDETLGEEGDLEGVADEDGGDEGEEHMPTQADLFGEDEGDDDGVDMTGAEQAAEEGEDMLDLFGDAEAEVGVGAMESQAVRNISVPEVEPLDKAGVYFTRLPQALRIESTPMTTEALYREIEEAKEKKTVLTESNVVRWKREQSKVRSNARVVRWSNGDVHLVVGDEVFDMTDLNLLEDNSYLFAECGKEGWQCQHRFSSGFQLQSNQFKKSKAQHLVGKKIQSKFNRQLERKRKMGPDSKITLTSKAINQPSAAQISHSKELSKIKQEKRKKLAEGGDVEGDVFEDPMGADSDDEKEMRLHHSKAGAVQAKRRRGGE